MSLPFALKFEFLSNYINITHTHTKAEFLGLLPRLLIHIQAYFYWAFIFSLTLWTPSFIGPSPFLFQAQARAYFSVAKRACVRAFPLKFICQRPYSWLLAILPLQIPPTLTAKPPPSKFPMQTAKPISLLSNLDSQINVSALCLSFSTLIFSL